MTLCRNYLQGRCMYGTSCKFEHRLPNSGEQNYGSMNTPAYTPIAASAGSTIDSATLVKSAINDMTLVEKGGQWLLSSYAPFKEKAAFPGFEDQSMEEIRFLFYEAVKNNTVDQYKQNLQTQLQQAVAKVKALQNPTTEAITMLNNIYAGGPSTQSTPTNPTFGSPPPNQSVFGAPPPSGIFGGSAPTASIFSGAPAVFAGAPANNTVFGAQPAFPSSNPPAFGAQPQTQSVFASNPAPTGSSIFGAQPQQTNAAPMGIFGAQPTATANTSIFGAPPQPANPAPGVFGAPPQPTNPAPGVFGAPPQSTNPAPAVFAAQPQQTVFGGQQAFAPQPTFGNTATVEQHSANIFGGPAVNYSTKEQLQTKPNEDFYSKIDELNEEEIKWFNGNDLDLIKIPEKPPTYEMCFK